MTKKRGQRKTERIREGKIFNEPSAENGEMRPDTVVDSAAKKKYEHRKLESNWARYEAENIGEEGGEALEEQDQPPPTEDFGKLLGNTSSDCSRFEFSLEKQWKTREPATKPSEIFNLNLELLSARLACVPFYERIGMDMSELSSEEVESYDKEAQSNRSFYDLSLKKAITKDRDPTCGNECFFNDKKMGVKRCAISDATNKMETKRGECMQEPEDLSKCDQAKLNEDNGRTIQTGSPSKSIFSDKDNLEDWLDSILDD